MGATSTSRPEDADRSERADAPTRQLAVPAAGVGDRCVNCGAPLASDQRYCVNCGERRGKPRFSVANVTSPAAVESTAVVTERPRRPPVSSGLTLILGVGVLVLALLAGVLIGKNNNNSRPVAASAPPQVVTINGGGAGGTAATSDTGGSSGAVTGGNTTTKTKGSKKPVATKKVVVTKQVAAKADAAANQVFGGASANLAKPTQQVGQSCSNGQAGCQNGQFTGNFFGGG